MRKVDRLGWAVTSTVRIGGYDLGVRSNTPKVDVAVRQIFAPNLVREPGANRNYSVRVHVPTLGRGDVRPFNLLFKGCTLVWRAPTFASVIDELVGRFDEHARHPDPSVLQLEMFAVVGSGRAFLLPTWVGRSQRDCSRLSRSGYRLVGGTFAELALGRGALLVREHAIETDSDALRRWCASFDGGAQVQDRVTPGEYPVAAWLFLDGTGHDVLDVGTDAVVRALRQVMNGDRVGSGAAVTTVAAALRQARVAVLPRKERDIPSLLERLI
jgi:hypothetical protein